MDIKYLLDFTFLIVLLLVAVSILAAGKKISAELRRQGDIFKGIEARLKGLEDVTSCIEKELRLKEKTTNIIRKERD